MSAEDLAGQGAVITSLAGLLARHPDLPAAYFTVSRHTAGELGVQLDSPVKVEAWREALGVDVDLMRVEAFGHRSSLEFDATVHGVDFHVFAAYEQATAQAGAA
ncbi:hypothetical protein OG562_30915 [Streptomyces sp. NBC_01275]|uniref:hypothetical protein n=1 Tax=Streptomyces sp. NBC_01275 TaxID=2903807 RepID=UPI002256A6A9|nr:hypothetical protein [Streptomyces sp. NBC_01275]MCX4765311.1 hypothetical protein [Streptomyces sp. NBC_01275]